MSKKLRLLLAAAIISVAALLPYAEGVVVPGEPSVRSVLNVEEPSQELIDVVKANDKVSDKKDRERLAVFSHEFSGRVPKYETTGQNLQDLYKDAGSRVFGTKMNDKYDNLSELVGKEALRDSIGDEDGFVTPEEREALSKRFSANAWVLGDE